jgi:N-hydroxyarylamine O-acetyltransferase
MNCEKYLERIKFTDKVAITEETLFNLHEQHMFNVPFENLDIHYQRVFDLQIESIFEKIVLNNRGGFCYELNNIFNWLLQQVGFDSRIISARVIDESGKLGPLFDHMLICIDYDNKKYLADVGYGDLFTRPLQVKPGIQSDGRNQFIIQKWSAQDFVLSMSSENSPFLDKYRFSLKEIPATEFSSICLDKQTNPSSYFVKNIICTKPTPSGLQK